MAVIAGHGQVGADSQEAAFIKQVSAAFPSAQVVERTGWQGGYWESRQRRAEQRQAERDRKARERRASLSQAFGLRAAGRAPEAPDCGTPSLEEVTLNHHREVRTGWACTLLEYPGGEVELRAYYVGAHDKRPGSHRRDVAAFDDRPEAEGLSGVVPPSSDDGYTSSLERADEQIRFESSIARSRASCMRRCLALQADHMLTLTKRGKFQTIDEAWTAFEIFSKSMRRKFGARWRFVAVPELHKEGGWHMHVALNGYWWVGLLRRLWMRALGGKGNEQGDATPGNIDIKSFARVRRSGWRIARYIAKYLGKGFSALDRGRRSYSASVGLHPDRVTRWREPLHCGYSDAAYALQRRLSDAWGVGRTSTYFWDREGRCGFVITGEKRKSE